MKYRCKVGVGFFFFPKFGAGILIFFVRLTISLVFFVRLTIPLVKTIPCVVRKFSPYFDVLSVSNLEVNSANRCLHS
jgi:hypothetical protein